MGFPNVFTAEAFPIRPFTLFLRKQKALFEKLQNITEYELKDWELFPKVPRLIAPIIFFGSRLEIEIYTDGCAQSPSEKAPINWESGIDTGRILVISGEVNQFRSIEINDAISPWLEGIKPLRMIISFFELLGAYIGV